MNKLIWAAAVFLVAITSAGVIIYQTQPTLEMADRIALVELIIKDKANSGYINGSEIFLSTPCLRGVRVPVTFKGVSIKVLTQDKIDALSRVSPVNYLVFERIAKTGLYSAEVEITWFWGYDVDAEYVPFGLNSGATFYCSRESGEWVETGGWFWIP